MTANEVSARLGTRHPVIQGPFGGGLSTARLAATVADLGGLGSFGAHVLSPDAIADTYRDIAGLTSGAFALNLWVSNSDPGGIDFDAESFARAREAFAPYFAEIGAAVPERPAPVEVGQSFARQVEVVLELRPPVFSFVFGIPSPEVLRACRERGIVTVGAATSVREALALDSAGVDLIVATGAEAGGHRPSFLDAPEDVLMGTFALVQLVATRVRTPVIAAGGIVDARGVRAAHALGAGGVQVGTAFLACEESGATAEHRALLFGERAERTVLTRSFSGRLARGLANRFTREMPQPVAPYPLQGWFVARLKRARIEAGLATSELASLWGGQSSPNLRHRHAADVFHELLDAYAEPLPKPATL